ncbi:histidinol-phosphatase [Desulforamulus aquiferis]|uniref:Histidinol-phosphatase n=1 Tax=Desulforamulus aquiferis TaxID=1397668 RepID=A0AAW7ZBC8_9FIRM|nr:histidinol-phosphatase [Desulforamulus aquiferis]MDO7786564.1 histidinol-phosphatase [Desulforamulus aquiferis]
MKKIDLHIHTIATISDSAFTFNIEKLKYYVESMKIDCIAITNHNVFDLEQFNTITENLDVYVLPGIEINLEKGHLLLISDNKELHDFSERCKNVQDLIQTCNDFITIQQLKDIFGDLSKYLLIPHYDKKPVIGDKTLSELIEFISAGEVNSPKKFIYCINDSDSLVPVIFSDVRVKEDILSFPTRQTYIDLDEISLNGIKFCFRDKNKVALSENEGNKLFQVLDNGLVLSTGLNVILGERSSGKTYTLKRIYETSDSTKYIKQFSLLETDEDADKRNFEKLLSTKQSSITQGYLKEFKEVVDEIAKIDIRKNEVSVGKYIESLIKNATEIEKADLFSKAILFSESEFTESTLDNLNKLIESVRLLIENTEYKELINAYIPEENLKRLVIELMVKYTEETEQNLRKRWVNDLVSSIKRGLQMRTAATHIEDINLIKIATDKEKINKFTMVSDLVKQETEILRKDMQGFKIVASSKKYTGAGELKKTSGKMIGFSDAYKNYEDSYKFLQELKAIEGLDPTEYYKYFVRIEYKILNKYGYEVSGGERSEFNLLQEINDALQYDMLLIDEPESSFDNMFLMNDVNELIKDISKTIPVVVVTHNSTVGASIKPDYVVYTKKKVVENEVKYQVYSGYPSDKQLKSLDGETISNHDVVLNSLEAGESAYRERGESYEVLKD